MENKATIDKSKEPYSYITEVIEKPFGWLILINIPDWPKPIWVRAKEYADDGKGNKYSQYYYDDGGNLLFTNDVLEEIKNKYKNVMDHLSQGTEEVGEAVENPVQGDLFDGQDLVGPEKYKYLSNRNWYKVSYHYRVPNYWKFWINTDSGEIEEIDVHRWFVLDEPEKFGLNEDHSVIKYVRDIQDQLSDVDYYDKNLTRELNDKIYELEGEIEKEVLEKTGWVSVLVGYGNMSGKNIFKGSSLEKVKRAVKILSEDGNPTYEITFDINGDYRTLDMKQTDRFVRSEINSWYKVSKSETSKIVFKDDFPEEADLLIENQEWSILLTDSNISNFEFDTDDIRKIVNIILMQEDSKKIVDILADILRRKLVTEEDSEYWKIIEVMDLVLQPSDWNRLEQMCIVKDEQLKKSRIRLKKNSSIEGVWDDELGDKLVSLESIKKLIPELVERAQKIYNDWQQDENGEDVEYGVGGICDIIAENFVDILSDRLEIPAITIQQNSGENHIYVIFAAKEGVFSLDINPHYYESGGGYNWKKLPNVKFIEGDISIEKLEDDPKQFKNYVGD